MNVLDRYILRQCLSVMLFVTAVLTVTVWLAQSLRWLFPHAWLVYLAIGALTAYGLVRLGRRAALPLAGAFVTYPLLQLGAGLPMLIAAIRAALEHRLTSRSAMGASRLWTHPTALEYLAHRMSVCDDASTEGDRRKRLKQIGSAAARLQKLLHRDGGVRVV